MEPSNAVGAGGYRGMPGGGSGGPDFITIYRLSMIDLVP